MKTVNLTIKYLVLSSVFILLALFNIGFAKAASAGELVNLTNSYRQNHGFSTLSTNNQLIDAANNKAEDMFKNNYFAHVSPSGKTPWDFIKSSNYEYTYAGENLSIGYTDDRELMEAWMNSELHRANILNEKFKEIGVAVVAGEFDGENTYIVVQMFGTGLETVNSTIIETKPDNEVKPQVMSAAIETENKDLTIVSNEDNNVNSANNMVNGEVEIKPSAHESGFSKTNLYSLINDFTKNSSFFILISLVVILLASTYLFFRYQNANHMA